MGNRKTRVLIASANPELMELLERVARNEPSVTVVAEAANAIEAAALGSSLRPDVVVVDAELPHVSTSEGVRLSRIGGLDTAISLRKELRETAVVVLSNWRDSLGQNTNGRQSLELCLYREKLAGRSRIKFTELEPHNYQENELVFAALVARAAPATKRRAVDASEKLVPYSVLAIIGGLALMLTVIGAAAGAVLAMGGAAALLIGIGVRIVAACWPAPHTRTLANEKPETEKVEAESDVVETRA